MNYESMSDFEINKAVAAALDMRVSVDSDSMFYTESYKKNYPNTVWCGHKEKAWLQMDYCNDPSDAWPIILSNKIDIQFDVQGEDGAYSAANSIDVTDNNPLRAAMIVFLKMQEELS